MTCYKTNPALTCDLCKLILQNNNVPKGFFRARKITISRNYVSSHCCETFLIYEIFVEASINKSFLNSIYWLSSYWLIRNRLTLKSCRPETRGSFTLADQNKCRDFPLFAVFSLMLETYFKCQNQADSDYQSVRQ